MEVNNFNLKYQPDGEIEPLESRVSAISIIGHRDPNPLPDCEGPQKHQKYIDVEDVIGFESRQMAKHEECCTLAQYPREENDENSGHEGWKIDKPEVCDIKLLQRERFDVCDEIGLLRQQMSKTEEFHTNILSPSTGVDNDESSRFAGQQMANSEVCDAEFLNCTRKDNDEKRSFKSQFVHQMPDTEHRGTRQFAQTERGKSDEKSGFIGQGMAKPGDCDTHLPQLPAEESEGKIKSNTCQRKREKYFFYEPPLCEETGVWIPVSVPPMSESEHEEWTRGFCTNGGTFPEEDVGWSQLFGEDKELTMWDVFFEMLLVARGKVSSFASTDIRRVSWISSHLVEQAWKEMAQTLTEANFGNTQEILETEPPKWLPDSAASACMLCSVRFHPIMCTRHHCRFCGGIFCNECSKGRRLLPARFRVENPQRVCDVCCVRLESVQPYLMDQVSRAAQLPTHDLTDLSTLRSWLNFPWGQSMEYEIYKCANTIRGYNKVGSLRPEKSIPDAILRQAKGLAILTVMKVGMMVTYNIGTGLVVARREDGSWSPPSAISSFGAGWGAQAGGELTDLIIVLRSNDAVRTFSSDVHLSVGAGLSAAVGIVGRTAEADVRAGTGGYAACYTYSCSKGAFIGCALEGSVVTTRAQENSRFYGSQSLNALDILLGSLPRPPAAAILYRALTDLYQKL